MTVLLFDAGGVLIELGPPPLQPAWLSKGRQLTEVWADFLHMPASRDFEAGRTDADGFARSMIEALGLQVESAQFIDAFTAWPIGPFEGTLPWLQSLGDRYTLAMLSNTNELHWLRMQNEMGLGQVMHHYFLSQKMGMVKPDPEIFQAVIKALNVAPGTIEFFDDNLMNVQAASSLGIQAHHVAGPEALLQAVGALSG